MGRTGLFPYYYGQHRWDNYLLDIQEAVGKNSQLLQEQTEELQEQTEELRRQTAELGNIRIGIEGVREDLQWGFMLVADRMDQQIELFSMALQQLDAIHKTLKSPLMTQAKELFEVGEQRLEQGLLDKALEAYLQSEQKNEVNFLLQRRIGMLFLEGANREYSVIDFAKAERHLLLAARYAQAAEKTEPNWKQFCAEAYYRAANASYLMGEQHLKVADTAGMSECLKRSLQYLAKALALRPEFTRCLYSQAKCYALLDHDHEALEIFKALSDRNRNHSEVLQDKDFDRIRGGIEEILRSALDTPGPLARSTKKSLDRAMQALAWLKRSQSNFARFEPYLSNVQRLLRSVDVNIEALNRGLTRAQRKMERITEGTLQTRLKGIESEMGTVVSLRNQSEQAIQHLQQQMAQTKGTGLGCLFAIVAYVGVILFYVILLDLVRQAMVSHDLVPKNLSDVVPTVVGLSALVIMVASFFLGRSISRARKNQPFRTGMQQQLIAIANSDSRISALTQQLEAARNEMQAFTAWCERPVAAEKNSPAANSE